MTARSWAMRHASALCRSHHRPLRRFSEIGRPTFQVCSGHGMQGCSSSFLDGSAWMLQVLIDKCQQGSLVSTAQRDLRQRDALDQPAWCRANSGLLLIPLHIGARAWAQEGGLPYSLPCCLLARHFEP